MLIPRPPQECAWGIVCFQAPCSRASITSFDLCSGRVTPTIACDSDNVVTETISPRTHPTQQTLRHPIRVWKMGRCTLAQIKGHIPRVPWNKASWQLGIPPCNSCSRQCFGQSFDARFVDVLASNFRKFSNIFKTVQVTLLRQWCGGLLPEIIIN